MRQRRPSSRRRSGEKRSITIDNADATSEVPNETQGDKSTDNDVIVVDIDAPLPFSMDVTPEMLISLYSLKDLKSFCDKMGVSSGGKNKSALAIALVASLNKGV